MQTLDHEVLEHLKIWLEEGSTPWLCTIVKTLGSSPRPVGSIVAIHDDGRQVGSVSGGCVEEDLIERLGEGAYAGDRPELIEYGVSAEENERLGLPCGGKLTLLLERLREGDKVWLSSILSALDKRRCVERHLELETGQSSLKFVEQHTSFEIGESKARHCFGPRMRMLLVGAGQLAKNLAELGMAMDYEVIVTDPREGLIRQWDTPDLELIQGMPDDVIRARASDRYSIVITLTHDPRIDDMALMEALESEAWYVGALGSKRTTEKRLQRLKELGLLEDQIARLHAPVGLEIGSKTPIEIAVAIMAELTLSRRKGRSLPIS
jgi:xanthine dehydrogenase accessory factor